MYSQGSLYFLTVSMFISATDDRQTEWQKDQLTWNFLLPHSRRMDSRQSVLPHSRWSSWATSYLQCAATGRSQGRSHSNTNTDWSMRSRATITPSHVLQPFMTLWETCEVCTHSAINTCIQLSIQIPRRATTTVDNPWWWVFFIATDVACKQGFRLWSKSY